MQAFKDLDFLEIGTSNFDTLIQLADNKTVGISVEPIKYYLDSLPSPANVLKINAAISITNTSEDIELYYIPSEQIRKHRLPRYFKGCNKLGSMHPKIIEHKLEHLAVNEKVKQIPIAEFLTQHNIRKIKFLKIDTEGADTFILEYLYQYLIEKDREYLPQKIRFETNKLNPIDRVNNILYLYGCLGYTVGKKMKNDTELLLN
tara:strand:+ start:37 stop:645 length:609 start_codon:yes stop_codon:yes gene_type:complete